MVGGVPTAQIWAVCAVNNTSARTLAVMAPKELVPHHVYRALAYVRLLNQQGIDPSGEDVNKFACTRAPEGDRREFTAAAAMGLLGLAFSTRPAGPVTGYMVSVGWAAALDDRVHLTALGHAVLRGLDLDTELGGPADPEDAVADVVLEPDDALALVRLTRVMARAGAGLLADPYFKAEHVQWITEATSLRRILVSSRAVARSVRGAETERALIALALASVPNASDLDVRATDRREFHDRCVLTADGGVLLIGSSVTGIGKHLTAVITAPGDVARFYRTKYENLWSEATPVPAQSLPGSSQPSAASGSG